jgi:energy-coupling factor transporter ATP-binding protein EcfA2
MRLAKLVLSGFKSFADPTEFRFDAPITGIVGPNGCGKSNVVDAIKWVLGERSAKSLRGGAMLDVIFAGSAARKPAGMASVTLCFDNPLLAQAIDLGEDDTPLLDNEVDPETGEPIERVVDRRAVRNRRLPIDADVVEVTRRLTSDAKSDYLINGKKVRLKDIRDLFLDTGIGNDAYSIIEQGKVDAMLLANPVERRSILEEAAGVARFRVRKVEAARKLESAEKNGTSDVVWKFVSYHHPSYSSDEDDYGNLWKGKSTWGDMRIRPLTKLFDRFGVDVVWNGHIHSYERTWPIREGRPVEQDGTIYMIAGGGGGGLEQAGPIRPPFQNNVRRSHHFVFAAVNGRTLELKSFDLDGRLFDTVTIRKRAATPATPVAVPAAVGVGQ